IDWQYFFHAWEMKGKYPAILEDPEKGSEAQKLFADAQNLLTEIVQTKRIKAHSVDGFFPANSVEDDIEVYADEQGEQLLHTFYNLRQQTARPNNKANVCLADFIAPKDSGRRDYIGAFAVTAGIGADEWAQEFQKQGDEYSAIMIKILADRLA